MKRTNISKRNNRLRSIKNIEEMNKLFHIKQPELTRTDLIKTELRKNYSAGVFPRGLYTALAKEHRCTRQRIEQLANKLFPDRIKRTDDLLKHECRVCETLVSGNRIFCTRGHWLEYSKNRPVVMCGNCGERPRMSLGLCGRCYQSYRFHMVEGVKEKHNTALRKYYSRPEIKLIVREKHKVYIKKYQQSPKGKAWVKIYQKARYDRLRNDPVRWATFLEKSREYNKRRYWEKKLKE